MSEVQTHQNHLPLPETHESEASKSSPSKSPGGLMYKSKTFNDTLKSPFVTGTNIIGAKFGEKNKTNEVYDYHDKLNGLIDVLDQKVKNLVHENQSNFLVAYKEQMLHVQKELRALKKKLDDETHKRKSDERFSILEQERDYFRVEALRLDKVCKEQQRVIQELKFKLKLEIEDKNYFEEYVLSTKKENKQLKDEIMQLELRESTGEVPPLDFHLNMSGNSSKRGQGQGDRNSFTPKKKFFGGSSQSQKHSPPQVQPEIDAIQQFIQPQLINEIEKKYSDIIQQLKNELDKEKKLVRQLRQEKSQIVMHRMDLAQILSESINEVKREILKRRPSQTHQAQREEDPIALLGIDVSKFTAIDKRNVVERFMSNTVVLDEIYGLVFGTKNPKPDATLQKNLNISVGVPSINPQISSLSAKSEGKFKYNFQYGFGAPGSVRLLPKELGDTAISKKSQDLFNELRALGGRRAESVRKDL